MLKYIVISLFCAALLSCSGGNPIDVNEGGGSNRFQPIELPDDLSMLSNEHFTEILSMLDNAKLIGVSEGTHGMIEPFYFRNALIKFLVEQERISVVAIESGIVESKLIFDYVNGADIALDSALNHGIQCSFERFRHNRELLIWLREFNSDKSEDDKVHIYGFDIPGCAPNPVLEDATVGFDYLFNYWQRVNPDVAEMYYNEWEDFLSILHIQDSEEDSRPHFYDIDSTEWIQMEEMMSRMENEFHLNGPAYESITSKEDYAWASQALTCARQNMEFLHSIGNSNYDYSPREKGQLNNIQWIMDREQGESILLFAHLGHLAKELHMHEEGAMTVPMCGEYLEAEFGESYKVIGNFYRKLDYFDEGSLILEEGTMAVEFQKLGLNNFYMELDKADTTWFREWNFGKPSSGGKVYMYPFESVDIIYYNDVQTWIDGQE